MFKNTMVSSSCDSQLAETIQFLNILCIKCLKTQWFLQVVSHNLQETIVFTTLYWSEMVQNKVSSPKAQTLSSKPEF